MSGLSFNNDKRSLSIAHLSRAVDRVSTISSERGRAVKLASPIRN